MHTSEGPFWVYAQGTITRALDEGQWWDDHLKPAIDSIRGGAAVDIGAHFGWFTRYLATRHSQVFACEPWPASFALLQANLARWHGVQCWPVAAYHCTATLGFARRNALTDAGAFGFNLKDAVGAPGEILNPVLVPAVRLDDYLPEDAPISLVKCDAQGADLQALQGMQQTIRRCQPLVLFEWEEGLAQDQDSTWEDYLRFFAEIGYSAPERITTDYWDYVARPR